MPLPLRVTVEHVMKLDARTLPKLLKQLLVAEAEAYGMAEPRIHVSEIVSAPDGGEDGRIVWAGDPHKTMYLPCADVRFQVKAKRMEPKKCAGELVKKERLTDIANQLVVHSATYIMFCNHPSNSLQTERREDAMFRAVSEITNKVDRCQFTYYGAERVVDWCNRYTSVCFWVRSMVGTGFRPFHSLCHLDGLASHANVPFYNDGTLQTFAKKLSSMLKSKRVAIRITGISGSGKTRRLLESFRRIRSMKALRDNTIYADASFHEETILSFVSSIRATDAIVVVDNCQPKFHQALENIATHRESNIRLITMDYDTSVSVGDASKRIPVERSSRKLINGMFQLMSLQVSKAEYERLVDFADGIPLMAVLLSNLYLSKGPAIVTDDVLVERLIHGRNRVDESLFQTAQLLSAFKTVGFNKKGASRDIELIAELTENLSSETIIKNIRTLTARDIIKHRDGQLEICPLPLALKLAIMQWKEWRHSGYMHISSDDTPDHLRISLVRQLAMLDKSDIAREVAGNVLNVFGRMRSAKLLGCSLNMMVLSYLCEVLPHDCLNLFERVFGRHTIREFRNLDGSWQHFYTVALSKLCCRKEIFYRAGALLFEHAICFVDDSVNHEDSPSSAFLSLFEVFNGATEAIPNDRLELLDRLQYNSAVDGKSLVIRALAIPLSLDRGRHRLPEVQGGGPFLRVWQPKVWSEIFRYQKKCLCRLLDIALSDDAEADKAYQAIEDSFSSMMSTIPGSLQQAIGKIFDNCGTLRMNLKIKIISYANTHHKINTAAHIRRVDKLLSYVAPEKLMDQIELFTNVETWEMQNLIQHSAGGHTSVKLESLESFVERIAINWAAHLPVIKQCLSGKQANAYKLGYELGIKIPERDIFAQAIMEAMRTMPNSERNPTLFCGILCAINKVEPLLACEIMDRVASDPDFIQDLSYYLGTIGISDNILKSIIRNLPKYPLLLIRSIAHNCNFYRVSPKIMARLADNLYTMDNDYMFCSAIFLFRYIDGDRDKLCALLSQVAYVARSFNPEMLELKKYDQMDYYYFAELLGYFIASNSDCKIACEVAESIMQRFVICLNSKLELHDYKQFFVPLLPCLVLHFPKVTWEILGDAIANESGCNWKIGLLMLNGNFRDILHMLPEDLLLSWCFAYPDVAPKFALTYLTALDEKADTIDAIQTNWAPAVRLLIDNFGYSNVALDGLSINIHSFFYVGNPVNHYKKYIAPLQELAGNSNPNVRSWADAELQDLMSKISKN